jgi:hypothetical protein
MAKAPYHIILHAGFHKTGTTTMQMGLRANVDILAPMYQVATLSGDDSLRQIAETARAFSLEKDPLELAWFKGLLVDWFADIADRRADRSGLLISAEDFCGHMPGGRAAGRYHATSELLVAFHQAAQVVFGKRLVLRLLFTTRAPEDWLASLHWQHSKHAYMILDREDFCQTYQRAADFGAVINTVAVALPQAQIAVCALEDMRALQQGPLGALLDLAQVPPALCTRMVVVPAANQRVTQDLAAQFVALNRLGLSKEILAARKQALLLSPTNHPPPEGHYSPLRH